MFLSRRRIFASNYIYNPKRQNSFIFACKYSSLCRIAEIILQLLYIFHVNFSVAQIDKLRGQLFRQFFLYIKTNFDIFGEAFAFNYRSRGGERRGKPSVKRVFNPQHQLVGGVHIQNFRRVYGDFRPLGIGADKSARPEKNSAEIPRHDHAHVGQPLLADYLVDRNSGGSGRLSVVAVAGDIVFAQDIGVAVVRRLSVKGADFVDEGDRLLLGFNVLDISDKLGFFLLKRRLGAVLYGFEAYRFRPPLAGKTAQSFRSVQSVNDVVVFNFDGLVAVKHKHLGFRVVPLILPDDTL